MGSYRAFAIALLSWVTACGGQGLDFIGDPSQPVAGSINGNVMYVPVQVNGTAPRPVAIDTGAPVTLLDPTAFSDAGVTAGHGTVRAVQLGGLTLRNLTVEGLSPCGMMSCAGGVLDGLIGGNVLSSFSPSIDYRGQRFSLLPMGDLSGVAPAGVIAPFHLEGGGTGRLAGETDVIRFSPTRVALDVQIEGVTHPVVVDTGASMVVLRSALFASLTADGRGQVSVSPLTVMGVAPGSATRVRSMVIGTGSGGVAGVPALSIGDSLFDSLAAEVGHPVDGLLGGTFLRNFVINIDYGSGRLTLWPYTTSDPLEDEFRRVGLTLTSTADGRYFTGSAFPGTDAATNPQIPQCFFGSQVTAIAGQPPDGLAALAADRLLRGQPGDTKKIDVISHCDGKTPLTFTFKVEELLPLP
jgi:hypothetical protein